MGRLDGGPLSVTPLAYRDHPLLTDRAALPQPFLPDAPIEPFLQWGCLLASLAALALMALWRMRVWRMRADAQGDPLPERASTGLAAGSVALLAWFSGALALRLLGCDLQPADSQELTYLLQVAYPRAVFDGPLDAFTAVALSPQMVSPHPPLFRVLLLFWMEGGDSLLWLRLPSVVFGAATVPLVFAWARRELGTVPAVVAAGSLAVSPLHIYYSQTVMPYTLLGVCAVAACSLHHRALTPGGPLGRYTLALAAGFVSHFIFPALVAPLALEAVWRRVRSPGASGDRWRLWRFVLAGSVSLMPLGGYSLALFFYADVMPFILPVIEAMKLFAPPDVADFASGYAEFAAHGLASTFADPRWAWLSIPGVVLVVVGAMRRATPASVDQAAAARRTWTLTLPVLFVAGFFFMLGLVTILGNGFFYFASRRFVPLVPFLYLLFAGGLWTLHQGMLERGLSRTLARVLALVLLLITVAPQLARTATQATVVVKPDVPGAAEYLDSRLETGDAVAVGPYLFFDFLYSWEVRGATADWYQAGGPPRWVRYQRDAGAVDVMLSPSDMLLPWRQVLEHAALRRVWLVEVDEVPFGLRELEGPGTVRADAVTSGGFEPCPSIAPERSLHGVVVSCFRRRQPAPLPAATLLIGSEDYRQVVGLAPPGAVPSRFRRLTASSAVILPWSDEGITLDFTTKLPPPLIELKVHAEGLDGAAGGEAVTLALAPGQSTHRVQLEWPPGASPAPGQPVRVGFELPVAALADSPHCFSIRRGRIQRVGLECGVFLRRAASAPEAGGSHGD